MPSPHFTNFSIKTTPKVVAFDFDGTVVLTMQGYGRVAAVLIAGTYETDPVTAYDAYMTTSGIPFRHQLELMFPSDSRNEKIAEQFEVDKLEVLKVTPPDSEVFELFAQLIAQGIAPAISSNNGYDVVQHYVKEFELPAMLALGYKEGFGKGKPHIDFMCEYFHCSPFEILFVGDSVKDGELARGLGLPFVARTGTFTREEFAVKLPGCVCVDKLLELVPLIIRTPQDNMVECS